MADNLVDDIIDVPYSEDLEERKTGTWRKVLNRYESGVWEVEVNFLEFRLKDFRNDAWTRKFETEAEAKAVYEKIKGLRDARSLLAKTTFEGSRHPEIPGRREIVATVYYYNTRARGDDFSHEGFTLPCHMSSFLVDNNSTDI